MPIAARLFLQKSTEQAGLPGAREVEFNAISRGDEAKLWSKWTPSARLTMMVTNPDAVAHFEVGAEYLVTMTMVRRAGAKEDLPDA